MEDFKFSTLEYKRPDFEKIGAFAEEITEKIKNAASYEELKGRWKRCRKTFRLTVRLPPSVIL